MIDPDTRTLVLGFTAAAGILLYRVFGMRKILVAYGVAIGLVVLYIAVKSAGPAALPDIPTTFKAPEPPVPSLAERLRQAPPLVAKVAGGEAHFQSAVEVNATTLRLLVEFKSSDGSTVLGGSVAKALLLLQESLCGTRGLLATFALDPSAIALVAYERGKRVGEIPVPSTYCR
jgi:hypothetical protein